MLDHVEEELDNLFLEYNKKRKITLEDIIDFHVKFERIHPFSDGNGRIGRMIMFKECLKNDIIPFIILDSKKTYYIRGLKEYDNDPTFLKDTILDACDTYTKMCESLIDER